MAEHSFPFLTSALQTISICLLALALQEVSIRLPCWEIQRTNLHLFWQVSAIAFYTLGRFRHPEPRTNWSQTARVKSQLGHLLALPRRPVTYSHTASVSSTVTWGLWLHVPMRQDILSTEHSIWDSISIQSLGTLLPWHQLPRFSVLLYFFLLAFFFLFAV